MNGTKLRRILERLKFTTKYTDIRNSDFNHFKESIPYAGKGVAWRDNSHMFDVNRAIMDLSIKYSRNDKKNALANLWGKGKGIIVIKLSMGISHFEALSKEYAVMNALGLGNLTNAIQGTPYGAMKFWKRNEVINFGNMLLYIGLKKTLTDKPNIFHFNDIITKKP